MMDSFRNSCVRSFIQKYSAPASICLSAATAARWMPTQMTSNSWSPYNGMVSSLAETEPELHLLPQPRRIDHTRHCSFQQKLRLDQQKGLPSGSEVPAEYASR